MWTIQTFIAGYADPEGQAVRHVDSLEAAKRHLIREHEGAQRFGAGYEPSEALLWHGTLDDVTDVYPDRQLIMGPRGGVQVVRV